MAPYRTSEQLATFCSAPRRPPHIMGSTTLAETSTSFLPDTVRRRRAVKREACVCHLLGGVGGVGESEPGPFMASTFSPGWGTQFTPCPGQFPASIFANPNACGGPRLRAGWSLLSRSAQHSAVGPHPGVQHRLPRPILALVLVLSAFCLSLQQCVLP